jgi:uncharacterized protein DUF3892
MAITAQVRCINKTSRLDPHTRIQSIGGINPDGSRWKRSQTNAIADIESGEVKYYVSVAGHSVWVIVATHNGNKYIKTESDGLHPNNLLALPECP